MIKRFVAAVLGAVLFFSVTADAFAASVPAASSPITEQTWRYLDRMPAGERSIVAYSLGGRAIKADAQSALASALGSGGISTVRQLESSIISMVKLGQNPFSYKKNNLLSTLYSFANLSRDGLSDVSLALLAYQSAQSVADAGAIPDAAPNSTASLLDYIVSSQQREGGFSPTAGHDPDVSTTAYAVFSLAAEKDLPYVGAALEKAIAWLSAAQNDDGSFSLKNQSSSIATALTLTALRVCGVEERDERFVKNGRSAVDALLHFQNVDGGYAAVTGGESDVLATELAVIALYTNETGLSPFLAPDAYPGYIVPEESNIQIYLRFFAGFVAMLAIIYGLILLTGKIGQKWGNKPLPSIPDPYAPDPPPPGYNSSDTHTIEINIPMNAALPDFDEIPEHQLPEQIDKL